MADATIKARARALVDKVSAERRRQNLTYEQLAEMAGVSAAALKNAERGATIPSLVILMAAVEALGGSLAFTPRQD